AVDLKVTEVHMEIHTLFLPWCVHQAHLSAHPGIFVQVEGTVTLPCPSELAFETFFLLKEGGTRHSQQFVEDLPDGHTQDHFSMGPVTSAYAGTYRCYGSVSHSPHEWADPSELGDLFFLLGIHKKPCLSAQLGPEVISGENLALFCEEGEAHERWLPGGQSHNGAFRAIFPLRPAMPAHGGTYRYYGSFNHSPCDCPELRTHCTFLSQVRDLILSRVIRYTKSWSYR
uniref:Immunoglobulin-like beta-sandwich domain-containing protein n=1 Tax=Equus caballus TaxID=9796 RepID=A0A3Q2KSM1_HORSE